MDLDLMFIKSLMKIINDSVTWGVTVIWAAKAAKMG
jgi:hypothetical protein